MWLIRSADGARIGVLVHPRDRPLRHGAQGHPHLLPLERAGPALHVRPRALRLTAGAAPL